MSPLVAPLLLAALGIGAVHSLAPDHWVPIAAVGRARGWTRRRTVTFAALCGLGHVTVSVVLAAAAYALGATVVASVGESLRSFAGALLIAAGVLYAVRGLGHGAAHAHGHAHRHYDHVHDPARVSAASLFLVYCADACVAMIPLFIAAVPLGIAAVASVVVVYEVATVGAMMLLVASAHAGAAVLAARWPRLRLGRWGHAAAGGVIAAVGVAMAVTGL